VAEFVAERGALHEDTVRRLIEAKCRYLGVARICVASNSSSGLPSTSSY
jgi:hypothetical protein